jgi:FKBP-type peptidyl-prolyl cis-trans isomerase FkpA
MIDTRTSKLTLFCLLSGFAASTAARQDNIPALLQFAEQYQSQQAPVSQQPVQKEKKAVKKQGTLGGKLPSSSRTQVTPQRQPSLETKRRQLKDGQIRQQQEQIAQLEQQVAALKKAPASSPAKPTSINEPDIKTLVTLVHNFKQSLSPLPAQQKIVDSLQRIRQEREALRSAAKVLTVKINETEKLNQVLQTQQKTLQAQYQSGQVQQQKQNDELAKLRTELAQQQAVIPETTTADSLKSAPARQAYAAGISLGEEILQMQTERQTWGVKADKKLILAGLVDAFSGQRKLTDSELNQALSTSEKSVLAARNTVLEKQEKLGANYLNTFRKDKQVRQAAEGFWYRVDYSGDEPIADNAIVDVVIKETLTDGTVIQDMETNGVTISQRISDFPPLFQAAIKLLKNHGSMQLVAQPELAYGEKGYPPKIPPNATMVYTLRIVEMYPESGKKPEAGIKR